MVEAGCAYFFEDYQPQMFLLMFLIEIQTKSKKKLFDKNCCPYHPRKIFQTGFIINFKQKALSDQLFHSNRHIQEAAFHV